MVKQVFAQWPRPVPPWRHHQAAIIPLTMLLSCPLGVMTVSIGTFLVSRSAQVSRRTATVLDWVQEGSEEDASR